ncbi:LOW QUALITY PROTEIN: glutathione hydrolase-like YwrD proenzyme [Spheniscus humboldti]
MRRRKWKVNPGTGLAIRTETAYFTVMDPQGNACSFIKCNCMGFGTGLIPDGGFTLQLALGKHPYSTINPTLATAADREEHLCSFRVMGEFTQPQGHVQVLLNMLEFGMNPQQALAAAWLCLNSSKRGWINQQPTYKVCI